MTIYLVSSGGYDYQIDGLFSSREKAEAFIASKVRGCPDYDRYDFDIEEWVVDERLGEPDEE